MFEVACCRKDACYVVMMARRSQGLEAAGKKYSEHHVPHAEHHLPPWGPAAGGGRCQSQARRRAPRRVAAPAQQLAPG